MATTTQPRTFALTSPHMTGEDVRAFQRELTARFEAWDIAKRVADDGDFGSETRHAAQQVCKGLGILHETAMEHGVTPELRVKLRHPDTRTPQEITRSESAEATRYRAELRKQFAAPAAPAAPVGSAGGVVMFDGVSVAAWIVPSLKWARAHGWTGHVVSGFRNCEHQKQAAAKFAAEQGKSVAQIYPNGPCASNHVGVAHPRGAVDVTNPQQLNQVLRNNPNHPKLVWGGPVIGDTVHFSATGH
jgi:hypothetical protein